MLITLPGAEGEISVNISEYWSDQYGIGIKRWLRLLCPLCITWRDPISRISVLARKTADIDPGKFVWSASVANCLGGESHYPPPK